MTVIVGPRSPIGHQNFAMSAAGPELLLADPVAAPCTGRHFGRRARQRRAFPERDCGSDFAETRGVPRVIAARQRPYQWDLASKLEPRQWHVLIVYALKAHGASENTGRRKWEKGGGKESEEGRVREGTRMEVGEGRGAPPPRFSPPLNDSAPRIASCAFGPTPSTSHPQMGGALQFKPWRRDCQAPSFFLGAVGIPRTRGKSFIDLNARTRRDHVHTRSSWRG